MYIGIDVVDTDRLRKLLLRRPSFKKRMFTDNELSFIGAGADQVCRLGTRFAAKEAVMKALGVGLGGVHFKDIEVLNKSSGEPEIFLNGTALSLAETRKIKFWRVSLTHTKLICQAMVVGLCDCYGCHNGDERRADEGADAI